MTYLRINDDALLEKYETIWTTIQDLKIIVLDALPVYDDIYTKSKIKFIQIFVVFVVSKSNNSKECIMNV